MNIYESFIKEKWNLLNNDSKLNLRNFLVGLLIKFVLDKNFYANPNNHFVINKLKSDPNVCENNMKLLILLSEEMNAFRKNSLTAKKAYQLREKMSKNLLKFLIYIN